MWRNSALLSLFCLLLVGSLCNAESDEDIDDTRPAISFDLGQSYGSVSSPAYIATPNL